MWYRQIRWKEPVFTADQFARLSNILDNAGNVFLALTVISPLLGSVDNANGFVIVMGTVVTIGLYE